MADVFGELDLFSEFEKHREAQGSFIHYDEDHLRSRIVFEGYEDEEGLDSEDEEVIGEDDSCESRNKTTLSRGSDGEQDFDSLPKESGVEDAEGEQSKPASSTNGVSAKKVSDDQQLTNDAEQTSWLNQHLYAQAAEEAKHLSSGSTQQLIYQRNKYRRYAKILDSTRYVPDEDSPSVQLIFNNNSFARKYRQQIEQFIKSLLWEELHSAGQVTVPEIDVKPGAPTCVDINERLPPEKKGERMRQKHAIIGNSQFHKQFLIDFLGWPFTVSEPTRCNVNWEIPLYGQVFNEVYADPTNKQKKSTKKQKPTCWNCGEESHAVSECKQPRNQAKINASRRDFLAQQQQNQSGSEPKFTGPSRYHLDPDLASEFAKFKPGVISEALQQALGLTQDQLPQHIYKMRLYGYPPGWLAEARQIQSGVTIFDKNGRVTLITGECLEDGELQEEGAETKAEYDVNKIVEYPGFTVPVPLGFIDEHSVYQMPPIQHHQLKKTLMAQTSEKSSSKKRKRAKDQDEQKEVKKVKTEQSKSEDGEIDEENEKNGVETMKEDNAEEITGSSDDVAAPSTAFNANPETKPDMPQSSSTISLSRDFGTPVLTRENSGLPDASKFGQGIEEHIPFENLPNSTGTFEKMRSLIDAIRNKNKKY